jgi:hypothetical protein
MRLPFAVYSDCTPVSSVKNEPRSFLVQWTLGILRLREAFFWLRVFSALKHYPSPPANTGNKDRDIQLFKF